MYTLAYHRDSYTEEGTVASYSVNNRPGIDLYGKDVYNSYRELIL